MADAEQTLVLRFEGDTASVNKAIGDYNRGIGGVKSNTANLQRQMETTGRSMGAAGKSLTRGVTLPLIALGAAAVKTAVDFESAFAGVIKTVDATDAQLAVLRQGIIDMARELPASREEIAGVAEAAGQLGIATEDILDFTRVMIDLGEATNMTANDAAVSLARFANVAGTSSDDFSRLGSTIVDLGNNMATTEGEIVEMAMRLVGAGSIVGLSEAQILSMAAALSSVGVEAQAGGTSFSKVMIQMASAAGKTEEAMQGIVGQAGAKSWEELEVALEKGGKALDKYAENAGMTRKEFQDLLTNFQTGAGQIEKFAKVAGVSAEEFRKSFEEDAGEAVASFVTGLGRIKDEGGDVFGVLESLEITEVRMRDALLRSAGAGDLLNESLAIGNEAWKENTALQNEAAQRYETTAAKAKMLWNQITEVALVLGDELLPIIQDDIMPIITDLAANLADAAQWFGELSESEQKAVLGLLATAAAAGPVLSVLGNLVLVGAKLAPAISAVSAGAVAAGTSLTGLGGILGVGLAGAGVAAAGAMGYLTGQYINNWEWVQNLQESTADYLTTLGWFVDMVDGEAVQAGDALAAAVARVGGELDELGAPTEETIELLRREAEAAHRAGYGLDAQAEAIKGVQTAHETLKDYSDGVIDAQLALEASALRVEAAEERYAKAVKESGEESYAARSALNDLSVAKRDNERKTEDLAEVEQEYADNDDLERRAIQNADAIDKIAESAAYARQQILNMVAAGNAAVSGGKFVTRSSTGGRNIIIGDVEQPKEGAANGGVLTGPTSGYNATLHGTEVVFPLSKRLSEVDPSVRDLLSGGQSVTVQNQINVGAGADAGMVAGAVAQGTRDGIIQAGFGTARTQVANTRTGGTF